MPETTRSNITGDGWTSLTFEPFRDGVTLHWIKPFEGDQPGVAILKYEPGAKVPRHRHEGLETILVLDGIQSDEVGDFGPGTYIVNPIDSEHSVWSEKGCVVLIQWDRPVTIFDAATA